METQTKRKIYIFLFTVFYVLLGFVAHALIELWFIKRLTADLANHSLGYSWAIWFRIHQYSAVAIFLGTIVIGFFQGRFWWRIVYTQRRMDPFFNWLKHLVGLR